MPELPEVETVVRSIEHHILGQTIIAASFSSQRVTRADHEATAAQLVGARLHSIERRGKQIWIGLDRGFLYVHLGMTGKLLWNAEEGKYTRAVLKMDGGKLVFDDIRMFGRVEYYPENETMLGRVGPDALTVSAETFTQRLKMRRGNIKGILLSQSFLAGIGNIYADEALFRAGIHPLASAQRLSKKRVDRLHSWILNILQTAIAHKGSSISDYVDALGERGNFQDLHNVYGRTGEPCRNCGSKIRRRVVAQRGTHYCPRCQRV